MTDFVWPPPAACPECDGLQMPMPDPRGWLAWRHVNTCPLWRDELAWQSADFENAGGSWSSRPTTVTERILLDTIGLLDDDGKEPSVMTDLRTLVRWRSAGIRVRRWPYFEAR